MSVENQPKLVCCSGSIDGSRLEFWEDLILPVAFLLI